MRVEVSGPLEYQSVIIGGLNKRKAVIENSDTENDYCMIAAEVTKKKYSRC
jgi:elongation factor G